MRLCMVLIEPINSSNRNYLVLQRSSIPSRLYMCVECGFCVPCESGVVCVLMYFKYFGESHEDISRCLYPLQMNSGCLFRRMKAARSRDSVAIMSWKCQTAAWPCIPLPHSFLHSLHWSLPASNVSSSVHSSTSTAIRRRYLSFTPCREWICTVHCAVTRRLVKPHKHVLLLSQYFQWLSCLCFWWTSNELPLLLLNSITFGF